MYIAIQNLRAFGVTYEKGKEYDSPLPKGYEQCFKKIGKAGNEVVETASYEDRTKEDRRRNKRTRNTKRSKKSSKD